MRSSHVRVCGDSWQSGAGYAFRTLAECRQAIDRLLSDAALRASLGHRGHAAAWRLGSADVHLEAYLKLIEDLESGEVPGSTRFSA